MAYKKLKADIKAKWLAALRLPGKKQAKGTLRRETPVTGEIGYCCLGVLCDIVDPTRWKRREDSVSYAEGPVFSWGPFRAFKLMLTDGMEKFKAGGYANTGVVPPTLAKSIGLTGDAQQKLSRMNDDGQSFSYIADWIEENL